MERLRNKWQFENCLSIDSLGRRGGLALLWTANINVEINSYSSSHIDAKVMGDLDDQVWRFTGFYGHFETQKRPES